jgi:hypothetical protein
MAELNKQASVTMQELLVSSLVQADALANLLIDNGVITREEFMKKLSAERAVYQRLIAEADQEYKINSETLRQCIVRRFAHWLTNGSKQKLV